jgi:NitT/TauT family transport system substrate-binding protein
MKRLTLAILACVALLPGTVQAEDALKLTVGQRGNFATSIAEIGQRAGIFKKHGFNLDFTYTQGSGETQQGVIAGSVQIGAETKGAGDLYWYVKKDSPIKTIKDYDGKTVAYSTIGSSTHGVVLGYIQQYGIRPNLVATGSPTATIVQVMSGQVDVGWSAPPDGLDQLDKGDIRVVSNGNDASIFKNQTVRVLAVNANYLKEHPDVVRRFMQAYRETVNTVFKDEAVLKIYADWLNISMAKAKRSRDDFYPFPALNPDTVIGLDAMMEDAVKLKFMPAPLTQAQLKELVQIQQP